MGIEKIKIIGLKSHLPFFIQKLHQKGFVETAYPKEKIVKNDDIQRIQNALFFISSEENLKKSVYLSVNESLSRKKEFENKSESILQEIEELKEKSEQYAQKRIKLQQFKEKINPLRQSRICIQKKYETETTKSFLGALPKKEKNNFLKEIALPSPIIDIKEVGETKKECFLFITLLKSQEEKYETLWQMRKWNAFDFEQAETSWCGEKIGEVLKKIEQEEKELLIQIKESEKKKQSLLKHIVDLKIAYDLLVFQEQEKNIEKNIATTEKTFCMEGLVLKKQKEAFQKWLKETFCEEVCLYELIENKPSFFAFLKTLWERKGKKFRPLQWDGEFIVL